MAKRTKVDLEREILELRKTVEVLNGTVSRLLLETKPAICLLPHYPCALPHFPTVVQPQPAPYVPIAPFDPLNPPWGPTIIYGNGQYYPTGDGQCAANPAVGMIVNSTGVHWNNAGCANPMMGGAVFTMTH